MLKEAGLRDGVRQANVVVRVRIGVRRLLLLLMMMVRVGEMMVLMLVVKRIDGSKGNKIPSAADDVDVILVLLVLLVA